MKLPSGWEAKRLRTLITINYGKGLPERERKTGSFFVFGANGPVGNHNEAFTKGQTLIIGRKGSVGAVNWSEHACWPIDTTYYIDEFPQNLDKRYLYYFLKSQPLSSMDKSAAIPGLNRNDLYNVEIPIPFPSNIEYSINFQRQIVARIEALLSEVREMREINQRIIKDTNSLMDSFLLEMLPDPNNGLPSRWGAKPLSSLASEESNQIIPSDHPTEIYNYWGLNAISEGQVAEPSPNYIQGKDVRSACVSFTPKNILYSKLRPYLNKVIVPSLDGIGSTEWIVYKPNQNIIRREYLAFVMRTKWFVNLASSSSYGSRMPRAKKSVLHEINVPLPFIEDPNQSILIQNQIVERIIQFSSSIDSMQKSNDQQEELVNQLEQSILSQAFRGEL